MYKLVGIPATQGPLDISMTAAASWPAVPGMTGIAFQALLMGDEIAGPYLALVAIPPRTEPMPLFPAHGHGTDTWRITLRGEMNMGARKYLPGEFRYQAGNKPYGSDDLAWGPDWGYSIVMMADRRGAPSFPPDRNPEVIRAARARTRPLFDWLGIDMVEDYAHPQGIATTLPRAARAVHVEGSFAETAGWPLIVPGVRGAAGLLGHAEVGPLLLHLHAEPGQTVFPAARFSTEVLHIAIAGSARAGDRELREGDLRLIAADRPGDALVAGPQGYRGTIVLGDRRALTGVGIGAAGLPAAWETFLRGALADLRPQLGLGEAAPAA